MRALTPSVAGRVVCGLSCRQCDSDGRRPSRPGPGGKYTGPAAAAADLGRPTPRRLTASCHTELRRCSVGRARETAPGLWRCAEVVSCARWAAAGPGRVRRCGCRDAPLRCLAVVHLTRWSRAERVVSAVRVLSRRTDDSGRLCRRGGCRRRQVGSWGLLFS